MLKFVFKSLYVVVLARYTAHPFSLQRNALRSSYVEVLESGGART